ncbi:hypothetical protein HON71_05245 [Candidatus Woesearchaeota archaeon]|jgi:hypothetical protein|nr:hypothetical protein [Candidatus Woesearchaeota archaeon]MBT5342002.1 hypothetical protein [Candidatus Woesearchaeota archaeon]
MKLKLNYSVKFYWGAILIIASFILGLLTKLFFFYPTVSYNTRISMAVIYIISWPMLFLGVYWMGKDYAESLQKYLRYKFYHKQMKKGTKKAYHATKTKTQKVRAKAKERTTKIRARAKKESNKFKERTNVRKNQIKSKFKRKS